MNKLDFVNNIVIYIRHITFIGFLYSGIIIYPSLKNESFGTLCLVLFIIYSLVTLIMFFIKSESELSSFLNNFVACILHIYMMVISYKYVTSVGLQITNPSFFSFCYSVASFSMFILIINKFLLLNSK